jgi:hypothetical protein
MFFPVIPVKNRNKKRLRYLDILIPICVEKGLRCHSEWFMFVHALLGSTGLKKICCITPVFSRHTCEEQE